MSTDDVLRFIDELCAECDSVTTDAVLAALGRKDAKASHVLWKLGQLALRCHHGLSFLRDYVQMESCTKRCFVCGHELVWDNDEDGVLSVCTCPCCGRTYEITAPTREECDKETITDYKALTL